MTPPPREWNRHLAMGGRFASLAETEEVYAQVDVRQVE